MPELLHLLLGTRSIGRLKFQRAVVGAGEMHDESLFRSCRILEHLLQVRTGLPLYAQLGCRIAGTHRHPLITGAVVPPAELIGRGSYWSLQRSRMHRII